MPTKSTYESLKHLRDDPSRAVILGGGRDGAAMLKTLSEESLMKILAVVDIDEQAPGMLLAKEFGINTYVDVEKALLDSAPCVVFNLTGNEMVEEVAANILGVGGVIGGTAARFIWRMVTDLKEAKDNLEFQATHDVLTNLVNRRFMLEQLLQEMDRCKRYDVTCSLVMIDLDKFKDINDVHGHAAGDVVLKEVSAGIKEQLRGTDTFARWGGEEFLALLPHTHKDTATNVAEKCLSVIKNITIVHEEKTDISASFSAGVASFDELDKKLSASEMVDALLAIVDRRLYRGKENGRSQIVNAN